ncbi:MAG: hypothetical protein JWR02_887 [Mucilaginibacter sp.]|nr:hypothetical protein [Mucilaginibacter sp.]
MRSYYNSSYLLVSALVALLLGAANYFLFNPQIVLFHWLGISHTQSFLTAPSLWSLFFRGHFSDAVWYTALCLVVSYLSIHKYLTIPAKFMLLLLPFVSEAGQYFSIVPGTFDWFDILTYLIVIIIYDSIFSLNLLYNLSNFFRYVSCSFFRTFGLIPVNMKKIKSNFVAAIVAIVFLLMVFASATQHRTVYRAPQKEPCVRHDPLNYSPVLVQINIDGSYTMKDLSGAQRSGQVYFMDALTATNTYKYKLAQGVTPNLNIYITINTDSYQHYGARVKFYVFDDNTWFDMPSNYVEPGRLFEDIAAKINSFVVGGWNHGCN